MLVIIVYKTQLQTNQWMASKGMYVQEVTIAHREVLHRLLVQLELITVKLDLLQSAIVFNALVDSYVMKEELRIMIVIAPLVTIVSKIIRI